jgi:hypothetical protein
MMNFFKYFLSLSFFRSSIHLWWTWKLNASFLLIALRVVRLDFSLKILLIARLAFRFNFSTKNSKFLIWSNDFSSFSAFSIRVFDFSNLVECWLISNLSQFSWRRLTKFEMLREFFSMQSFAVFEAYFEIVSDFFIRFQNRNLILH